MVHTMLLASNYIPVRSFRHPSFPNLLNQGMHCDVVFGSPSADCHGTGICKITGTNGISILNQKKECRKTQAVLLERPDNQGITLIFFRNLLCTQLYRHHFWKGILEMTEGCLFPDALRSVMQTPFSQIAPGKYSVQEESDYFQVELDCW